MNKLLNPLLKDKDEITQVTITVKKKDAILSGDNPEPVKYYVSALIEFADISKTINNF